MTLTALIGGGRCSTHLVGHLLDHLRRWSAHVLLERATLLPVRVMIVVERSCSDTLHVDTHGLRFVQDTTQAVDQVLMIIVALVYIKHGQN